ncbi:MAG: hypothetical protein JNM70_09575 [Anaerolineae bacterium]|nr:hypothetical protein [Anaerolineae bacterium]
MTLVFNLLLWMQSRLLACYPAPFQAEFAAEMNIVFRLSLQEACAQGHWAVAALIARELRDWPGSLAREHLRQRRRTHPAARRHPLRYLLVIQAALHIIPVAEVILTGQIRTGGMLTLVGLLVSLTAAVLALWRKADQPQKIALIRLIAVQISLLIMIPFLSTAMQRSLYPEGYPFFIALMVVCLALIGSARWPSFCGRLTIGAGIAVGLGAIYNAYITAQGFATLGVWPVLINGIWAIPFVLLGWVFVQVGKTRSSLPPTEPPYPPVQA